MNPRYTRRSVVGGAAALLIAARTGAVAAVSGVVTARHFTLGGPDGREIRISEWKPAGRSGTLILFSHGAASSPRFYEALIAPWVAAGCHVMAPLHVDSLEHPNTKAYPGLASWKARLEDMRALSAHVGNRPWIAAGHSYGGLVALTMGGAAAIPPKDLQGPLADRNARCVIAFSPPAPIPVLCTADGYAKLSVPALIQTGTRDIVPGMTSLDPEGWRGHLVPFDAAALGGNRYALVLEDVDHYFGGAICRDDVPGPPQTDRLADAVHISTLFIRAHGRGDKRALRLIDARITDALPVMLLHK